MSQNYAISSDTSKTVISASNTFGVVRPMIKIFPTLYKKDSKGRLQYWKVEVHPIEDSFDRAIIRTQYGKEAGKEQQTGELISEGKNLGKVNETTPYAQAVSEAEARWTKQVERKGYVSDRNQVDVDLRPGAEPMLAHRYDKHPEKIDFPCYIQPKLDGHRCIAVYEDGKVELFSRQRKRITGLPHVEEALVNLMAGSPEKVIFDGELYSHDYKNNFEELTSHIRNEEPKEGYQIVQYHIYDLVVSGLPFKERALKLLTNLGNSTDLVDSDVLKLVETLQCEESEVSNFFKQFRSQGYEGAILRNFNGLYVGTRSYDLQKVKEFADDEFEIVGVEEGRGKMKGHAIFVCHTHEGKEFKAKMKGPMEKLMEYYQNSENYIGKKVTVQFQEYTKDGIPRFPVAIRFKEDV